MSPSHKEYCSTQADTHADDITNTCVRWDTQLLYLNTLAWCISVGGRDRFNAIQFKQRRRIKRTGSTPKNKNSAKQDREPRAVCVCDKNNNARNNRGTRAGRECDQNNNDEEEQRYCCKGTTLVHVPPTVKVSWLTWRKTPASAPTPGTVAGTGPPTSRPGTSSPCRSAACSVQRGLV